MPVNARYVRSFSGPQPFVVDITGKGEEAVERMIDKINGDMFLDFSSSSMRFDELDLNDNANDDENDSVDSDEPCKRGVTFPEELVSHVWERPYTTAEEKKLLFYSGRDIGGFRLEYRAILRAQRAAQIQTQTEQYLQTTLINPTARSAKSGFSAMLHKATQVANVLSQSGQFLSKFAHQEDTTDAMLVVDTLYLF
jgi:hypothetical protein